MRSQSDLQKTFTKSLVPARVDLLTTTVIAIAAIGTDTIGIPVSSFLLTVSVTTPLVLTFPTCLPWRFRMHIEEQKQVHNISIGIAKAYARLYRANSEDAEEMLEFAKEWRRELPKEYNGKRYNAHEFWEATQMGMPVFR